MAPGVAKVAVVSSEVAKRSNRVDEDLRYFAFSMLSVLHSLRKTVSTTPWRMKCLGTARR